MQVYLNYPKANEEVKLLLNNLAIVKSNLILKSIDNLSVDAKIKDKVFEKVLEILSSSPKDDVI